MNLAHIRKALSEWYEVEQRHLPWRETTDPYCIWISEIILQQTRVAQGLDYYLRFIEHFPTVADLARATEEEVLRLWQGLGYYSRARNLHAAAQQIMTTHHGIFPSQYTSIRALKGIGDYTAAAISSIAFNLPYAVVDGNVYRVLARLTNNPTPIDSTAGKKLFSQIATTLLDPNNPRTHNQAMMELGAIQCVPGKPQCTECPLYKVCEAAQANTVAQLPYKEKRTKITQRYFHYIYIEIETTHEVFLHKRIEKDIWQHLYEPPLIETDHNISTEELIQHSFFQALTQGSKKVEILGESSTKHILSHQHIYAHMLHVRVDHINEKLKDYLIVPKENEQNHPIPRLIELLKENSTKSTFEQNNLQNHPKQEN